MLRILTLLLACCGAAAVQAETLEQTSDIIVRAFGRSVDFTSDTTTSTRDWTRRQKVVQAARDDAAAFVASGGTIRTARLEAAFLALRETDPQNQTVSDRQLAESILTL